MLDTLNDLQAHTRRFEPELRAAVARVLASGWFALGPEVEAFEREFAEYCGSAHCVGVANGTDALELALRAVGVEAGDSVITAANAGGYASHAIVAAGAQPRYADISETSLGLCPEAVEQALDSSTRAVIATHLYGRMADVIALREIADRRGIALIEDCAQAHGAAHAGVRAGAWGDAAAFSFYPTKNLGALGDGGAITTSCAQTAERARRLRQYGWESRYVAGPDGGRNSRLDEIQAAVLRAKLPRLDELNAARRAVARAWVDGLSSDAIRTPDVAGTDYVAHLFVVQTDERDALRAFLAEQRIASDIHYPRLDPEQPAFAAYAPAAPLVVSERVRSRVVTLPCHPELATALVARACEPINAWGAR